MSYYISNSANTQNELLMQNLTNFYKDKSHLNKMMKIINGESNISLRIVDWFVTNYAKKYYTVYDINVPLIHPRTNSDGIIEYHEVQRFKVYNDYKLKLKSYSKKRFDPFCRWERINIPYDNNTEMETTIGQLNFFKWAIENDILDYIEQHHDAIERDMNDRNSTSIRKRSPGDDSNANATKTRKKREELSISACKCIKKETVKIVVKFN
jgi:hypothetical protein